MIKEEAKRKNVPEVRFEGFEGEWERKKLREIGSTFSGLSGKTKADFGHGKARYITYMNVFSNPIANPKQLDLIEIDDTQNKVQYGDVLFTTSSETPEEVGMSSVWLQNMENIYLNSFCFGYRPDIDINNEFLAYLLRSDSIRDKFIFLAQGISRYNISKTRVMDISLPLPSVQEQSQIGTLFHQLDNQISHHRTKLQKLQQIKQAMLTKMFPQDGAKVPEVRFEGFEGEWEEKKLGEIGEIVTGSTPTTTNNSFYSENGTPWVTPTDINNNITYNTAKRLSKEGEKVSRMVPAYTILVTSIASIGKNTLLGCKGSFNQQINGLIPNFDKYDAYFLYSNSYHWSNKMKKSAGAGTMQIVNKTEFSQISTLLPSLPEQSQIGSFFQQLDTLLAQHQKRLDKLGQIKSALLDKLFV